MEMQVYHCNGACVGLEYSFGVLTILFRANAPGKCDESADWVVVSVMFMVGDSTPSGEVSVRGRS